MAGKRKIGAIIALDGEKEFKQAVTNVNKELGELKARTKLTTEQFAGQANTVDALREKQEILAKVVEVHKKKEDELSKGLKNAQSIHEKYGKKLEDLKKNYQAAADKMEEMEKSSKHTTEELEEQRREVERLAAGVKGSEEKYQIAANRIKDWETKLNRATAETIKANRALEENQRYLNEAENSTDKCAKSIDTYGKKVKEAVNATLDWKSAIKEAAAEQGIEMLTEVVSELGEATIGTATELQKSANQIQASTGKTALAVEEYRDVLESLYKENYGDNLTDVADVITTINENMNDLSKTDLQNVAKGAITLRDTFDMDISETIRGVNGLVENMGVEASEAMDLIAKGAQSGLNKTNELGDNLAEYTQIWGQAGFSAEQMFAILENGLDSGAYNLDKVNDYVKEFTISLSDGRIEEGLGNFSAGTQEVFRQWQSGGATAAQVFESVIADLAGMENQQEALTIASNTWSALGEDNAMKVITSLNNVNDTYKDVRGTMESIQDIKYDDVTSQLTQIARTIQMKFAEPLAKDWLPAINDGLEFVSENIEMTSAAVIGLGGLVVAQKTRETALNQAAVKVLKKVFLAKEAENIATEAGTAATTKRTAVSLTNVAATAKQAAATKVLTAQQKAYNAVASLSPMGKVALVLGGAAVAYKALEHAIVETDEELVKNREEVEALCDEYDSLKSSIDSASEARQETIDDITTEYMGYQTMAEKLVELAEKENKTSGEMALMQEYVNQLNEAMPSLNLAIDSQTGSLNMSTDAMYNQITAMEERAKMAAYEETLTDILKESATAELELAKLEQERNDIAKKKQELEEEYTEKLMDSTDAMNEYAGSTEYAAGTSVAYLMELKELTDQEEELSEREADCKETIDDLNQSYDVAVEKISGVKQETSDAAGSMEEMASASEDAANTTVASTQVQSKAYIKLKESVAESVKSAISMLEEFSGGQEISAQEILNNLNSQIDGMTNWKDNMQILAGATGEGMTEEFYAYLAEMGPESANLVQTLVDSLKSDSGKFTEICEDWTEAMKLEESLSEEVASGYQAAVSAIEKEQSSAKAAAAKAQEDVMNDVDGRMNKWTKSSLATAQKAGAEQTKAQSYGMVSNVMLVTQAGETVSDAAVTPLEATMGEAYKQGAYMVSGFAKGIADNASQATTAAQNMATNVLKASSNTMEIHSPSRKMIQQGKYVTQGMAIGIMSELTTAKASMTDVCEAIFKASTDNLEIHSPSKKFKEKVGEQISKGVAFGIAAKKGTAIKNSKSLADDVFKAASTWMDDYKKKNKVSLEDEKYFWKQVSKTVKKGTAEYKNALKNVEDIEKYQKTIKEKLENGFDVGTFKIGTDGNAELKTAEEYYSDLYQAANKYFSNYEALHNVSLQEEEYYWQQVLKKMQKGTQGYIDAKKQLKEVQSQIKAEVQAEKDANKQYALSGGALDAYKTYYQVSEKAEVQYWNIVRKKFKKGTAERIEADQKYYEAKEKYNEKLEELNEEYYENCKEVNEKLAEDIQELTDTYNDAVSDRKDSIYSSFSLFDQFESTSASGSTLLYNLRTQVAGIADWEQQLQKLGDKNILSDELLQELADMGPEAAASIHALNQLSATELKEYEKLWEQKNALAEAQAVKENEQLRKETQTKIDELKNTAQQELSAYKTAYKEAVAEVKTAIEEPLEELAEQATSIGEDAVAGLIKGISDKATAKDTTASLKSVNTKISKQLGKLEKAGKTIGDNTLQGIIDGLTNTKKINSSAKSLVNALKKAIQKEADIHSPSRLFKKEIGENIGDGVALGIEDKTETVNRAGVSMIQSLVRQQEAQMQKQQQQQEIQSYATSISGSAGMAELNQLISVAPVQQLTAQVDNSGMMAMMAQMISVMQDGFEQMGNMQIVTDTGAIIGETSTGMSEQLATMYRRKRR